MDSDYKLLFSLPFSRLGGGGGGGGRDSSNHAHTLYHVAILYPINDPLPIQLMSTSHDLPINIELSFI